MNIISQPPGGNNPDFRIFGRTVHKNTVLSGAREGHAGAGFMIL